MRCWTAMTRFTSQFWVEFVSDWNIHKGMTKDFWHDYILPDPLTKQLPLSWQPRDNSLVLGSDKEHVALKPNQWMYNGTYLIFWSAEEGTKSYLMLACPEPVKLPSGLNTVTRSLSSSLASADSVRDWPTVALTLSWPVIVGGVLAEIQGHRKI